MATTMTKVPFNGHLNPNEIFGSIFNMIISQQVFADNIKGTYGSLVNRFRTDGSMYGDTKLFYATDVLESHEWGADDEAQNLLALDRPMDPVCQAITLDKFRQIRLTVDNYLTKRAWSTESAFSSFNSVMLGWIRETKKVYDATLMNAYVGTIEAKDQAIHTIKAGATPDAQTIALTLADLFVLMKDVNRDFNSYGFLRSYDVSDLLVVWNSKYVNQIKKIDLPTIFHNEGLMEKFEEEILPTRYFGTVINAIDSTYTGTVKSGQKLHVMDEGTYFKSGNTSPKHLFAGDILPEGYIYKAGEVYVEDATVICKVIHKDAIKFMSAFEVGTSFFNPRSLTENHYLTFGFSSPDYLRNYPIVSVVAKA